MSIPRQKLIQSLANLVDASITRAQLEYILKEIEVDTSDPANLAFGKEKSTRLCLTRMTDERIVASARKAIMAFRGIEESARYYEEVETILAESKDENLTLYFGSSEKLDIYISDTTRGIVSEIDLKGFLKIAANTQDEVSSSC